MLLGIFAVLVMLRLPTSVQNESNALFCPAGQLLLVFIARSMQHQFCLILTHLQPVIHDVL